MTIFMQKSPKIEVICHKKTMKNTEKVPFKCRKHTS